MDRAITLDRSTASHRGVTTPSSSQRNVYYDAEILSSHFNPFSASMDVGTLSFRGTMMPGMSTGQRTPITSCPTSTSANSSRPSPRTTATVESRSNRDRRSPPRACSCSGLPLTSFSYASSSYSSSSSARQPMYPTSWSDSSHSSAGNAFNPFTRSTASTSSSVASPTTLGSMVDIDDSLRNLWGVHSSRQQKRKGDQQFRSSFRGVIWRMTSRRADRASNETVVLVRPVSTRDGSMDFRRMGDAPPWSARTVQLMELQSHRERAEALSYTPEVVRLRRWGSSATSSSSSDVNRLIERRKGSRRMSLTVENKAKTAFIPQGDVDDVKMFVNSRGVRRSKESQEGGNEIRGILKEPTVNWVDRVFLGEERFAEFATAHDIQKLPFGVSFPAEGAEITAMVYYEMDYPRGKRMYQLFKMRNRVIPKNYKRGDTKAGTQGKCKCS